jgi:hypothetical protein
MNIMKKNVTAAEKKAGIWLNQEKAFIFKITGTAEPVMEKIRSEVELKVRYAGEKEMSSRAPNFIASDKEKRQRRQQQERVKYFRDIIRHITDADYIYIFGPGETKHGLLHAIEKDKRIPGRTAPIETAGRMTLSQMRMKVKEYFLGLDFRALKKEWKKLQRI